MPISRLSIVAFQETHCRFTARCLEHDITATGRTTELAVDALLKIVRAHINFDCRHATPFLSAFTPAPRLYWDAFRRESRHWMFDVPSGPADSSGRTQVDVALVPQHPAIRPALAVRIA
jgi:hypothetical protein